jgi:cellulose synthase/poly-beta-1,6-N-acetylglucosamine synthase-like glycosyltransferase
MQHPNIRLVNMGKIPPNFSPKKWAIQTAIAKAKGDIILATDADCRVGKKWIETMLTYFEPDVGFVIGFSQFGAKDDKQNLVERFQAFDFVTLMGVAVGSTNLGFPMAASGQNLGYRKSIFQCIGGYHRVAHRVSGDDVLLLQLVRKFTSTKIVFAAHPAAYAVSKPEPTVKDFINQRKRWASNGSIQLNLNFGFFLYLMQVLLFNAALLISLVAALVTGQFIGAVLICIVTRVLLEFTIALRSTLYFHRTDLLIYFPLWFLVQIPYIVGVGLAGTFGKFRWKEREHSAEVRTE